MPRQPRPFYSKFVWKDWLADTRDMTPEAKGVYIDLLAYAATNSDDCASLPDDPRRLARAAGVSLKTWLRIADVVLVKWIRVPTGWQSKRLRSDAVRFAQLCENQQARRTGGAPEVHRKTTDGPQARARKTQTQIEEESKDALTRAGSQANGEPDPRAVARDLAASLGMPAPSGADSWGFDASLVDRRFSRLPGERQRELRGIAGWLWKTGTQRMDVVLRLLEHLQATRAENPYALLAEGSERRLDLEAKAREKIAADEKRLHNA